MQGRAWDKNGVFLFDSKGNIDAENPEKDDIEHKVLVWSGKYPLSLFVHSDFIASICGRRFDLFAYFEPYGVAPVVVGKRNILRKFHQSHRENWKVRLTGCWKNTNTGSSASVVKPCKRRCQSRDALNETEKLIEFLQLQPMPPLSEIAERMHIKAIHTPLKRLQRLERKGTVKGIGKTVNRQYVLNVSRKDVLNTSQTALPKTSLLYASTP